MKNQRIAIIGAGTAGLAAATLLSRQGHDVTVIERAPSLTAVGAGILLQPSGLAALSELGCLDHILQYGHRIDALYGWARSGGTRSGETRSGETRSGETRSGGIGPGRVIMQVQYAHLQEEHDVFGLGVHRAALCHVLDAALSGVSHKRWFACEVSAIEQNSREAVVSFQREAQTHREAFDAVLVANGSASKLRPQDLVRYDRQYPWGAMWLIRPLTESLASLNRPQLQQRYDGSAVMLGALPTGCIPADTGTPMLSLFWSLPVADMLRWQAGDVDLGAWKDQVVTLWPELSPLVDTLQRPAELLPATYRDVILSRWGSGRIGVIGDAAHAMSPQLGQGANMALLDASAIARAVAASDDWEGAWAHFSAERSGSIRFYQAMSRLLTPLFQSRIPGAALVRDLALPVSHLFPWLRRQMAETVAGRKQKWI